MTSMPIVVAPPHTRPHPLPEALWKALLVGRYMHLLVAPFVALGAVSALAFHRHGQWDSLLFACSFFALAFIFEYGVVFLWLYQRQYCRLLRIFIDSGWNESAARTMITTPCQQLCLQMAATEADHGREARAFLQLNQLSTWRVWAWQRAAKVAQVRRLTSPFSLPAKARSINTLPH